ncbi:hypothetical protein Tco_1285642 [Tanacetum coccineum]
MTRSTVKRLTKLLDEPEIEFRRLRKAAMRSHQNESLAIAGRNLFDDEASSSNNTGAKLPTPPKTLHKHSRLNSSDFQNPITFPSKQKGRIVNLRDILKKHKKDDKGKRLLSIFKQIHINLPFLEAMIHMPKGAKLWNYLHSHKEKLEKAASLVKPSEECSAIIQRSLPQKEGDLGSFTLPCLIRPLTVKNALADLRASLNRMPHSLFRRLGISKLKTTKMSIQLADHVRDRRRRASPDHLRTALPRHGKSCDRRTRGKIEFKGQK